MLFFDGGGRAQDSWLSERRLAAGKRLAFESTGRGRPGSWCSGAKKSASTRGMIGEKEVFSLITASARLGGTGIEPAGLGKVRSLNILALNISAPPRR